MRRMVCACGARRNPAVIRGLGGRIWRAAETPTAWGVGMTVRILHGDCRDVLRTLADASVDSVVTDPPYELGFMGKKWDRTGVANDIRVWAECLRVLKPGGHLAAFGGTRTYHRMVCAIEDAGFEVRDQLGWVYGSGFPKSRNLSGDWQGWGTALKPAWEPIVLARKALVGTVEANVHAHGTGALNIDGCRVVYAGTEDAAAAAAAAEIRSRQVSRNTEGWGMRAQTLDRESYLAGAAGLGRWPANILHDGSEEVVALFPSEAGAQAPVTVRNGDKFRGTYGAFKGNRDEGGSTFKGDTGSAARFFYCAKADRADRNAGLDGMPEKPLLWSSGEQNPGAFQSPNTKRAAQNNHPTVKPTDLMRWLCRLVTPPGGIVLDPFIGSGSTLKAAELEGFSAIGIELEAEYIEIARRRIAADAPLFAEVAA